jgi:D-alanyl-D-alanine dipeptidase
MAGEGRGITLSRRAVAFGLAALPLAGCAPIGPDRDVLFIPADKAAALTPDDPKRLLELIKLDPAIRLDMRYATANNFTGRVLYDEARAFLAAPAAQAGQLVEMPTEFDDFSEKAHRNYAGASAAAIANRARLARYLEAEGFIGLSNEWWHFDFTGWEQFPVMDIPFNKIV